MARALLLCAVTILVLSLVANVHCQEGSSGGGGVWRRFLDAMQSFFEDLRGVWNDFKAEVRARTVDIRGWSQEVWDNFKQKMNEWVNDRSDISESEKNDMRNYIERLQMPEENDEQRRK